MHPTIQCRKSQTGAVAIVVGVSLAVLVGFAGLALDLGRLYINKTELQNAVDACALAAAVDLNCDPDVAGSCTAGKLKNAENAGVFAAGRNSSDFQNAPVTAGNSKLAVTFSTDFVSGYASSGAADPKSKYAKCTAESQGIVPWFMGVLGLEKANLVGAYAVATLGPGQSFCGSAPMGICNTKTHTVGEWLSLVVNVDKDDSDDAEVDPASVFRWIDFDPNAGGTDEVRDRFAGQNQVCGLKVGDNVRETGAKQGVKAAYNTRFGLYKKAAGNEKQYSPETAPPDATGYAFPTSKFGDPVVGAGAASAYDQYLIRQAANTPFVPKDYDGNAWGSPAGADAYKNGSNRRLVSVPLIACPGPGKDTKILKMNCALMLNPMNNGKGKQILYLQYRDPSECQTSGLPGAGGAKVPQLVQ